MVSNLILNFNRLKIGGFNGYVLLTFGETLILMCRKKTYKF